MPIIISDVKWSETETKIDLSLPKKNVNSRDIDVFCTNRYLKVNYTPYFYEVFLKYTVDDNKTVVVYEASEINISLFKVAPLIWEELSDPSAVDRSKRMELKKQAIEYHEKRVQEQSEERAKVKAEQNRWALRCAMDQDSNEKERIESVKQYERDRVTKELNEWYSLEEDTKQVQYLESIKQAAVAEKECDVSTQNNENVPDNSIKNKVAKDERALKYEKIKHNLANPLEAKASKEAKEEKKVNKPSWESQGPRKKTEISVSFTPRYFPSAARESLAQEEEEWIEKNVRALTAVKKKDRDTKVEERNPLWLKDKASAFYKSGNFPAAVNAYSEAITISPDLPSLYINRASCYIVLNLFEDCVADCTKALSLLNPPVKANRMSRVKALVKRGSAFCQLSLFSKALDDYILAQKLHPENSTIEADIRILKDKLTEEEQT